MRSFVSAPICPSCLFATRSRNAIQSFAPRWPAQRFVYTRTRDGPSRMVLSDRVARPPRRDSQDGRSDRPQRRSEGPFGGMNQTYANIREPTSRRTSRISDDRGSGDRRGKTAERRTKAMKMQHALSPIPYLQRVQTKSALATIESFDQFAVLPAIKEAMSKDVLRAW